MPGHRMADGSLSQAHSSMGDQEYSMIHHSEWFRDLVTVARSDIFLSMPMQDLLSTPVLLIRHEWRSMAYEWTSSGRSRSSGISQEVVSTTWRIRMSDMSSAIYHRRRSSIRYEKMSPSYHAMSLLWASPMESAWTSSIRKDKHSTMIHHSDGYGQQGNALLWSKDEISSSIRILSEIHQSPSLVRSSLSRIRVAMEAMSSSRRMSIASIRSSMQKDLSILEKNRIPPTQSPPTSHRVHGISPLNRSISSDDSSPRTLSDEPFRVLRSVR